MSQPDTFAGLKDDLLQKAMFNESQRTYNALEWKAVAFEQKRIADELESGLERRVRELRDKCMQDTGVHEWITEELTALLGEPEAVKGEKR